MYPDSSVIYITDDDKSGGSLNTVKAEQYGEEIYFKILSSDSLNIDGIRHGLCWREKRVNKVVIGYLNVPLERKRIFDQALATFKTHK